MGMTVRRGVAAGLMLAAMLLASMAMSGAVAAQQAGTIQSFGTPKVTASNLATTPNGGANVPQAIPAFAGYPYGYGNYYGYGYNPYSYGYGYGYNQYSYAYNPYSYGYNYGYNPYSYGYGYGYSNLSGNAGCVPSVSYTPAFGYGYGCQRVGYAPVAYPAYPQSPYQVGR